MANAPYDIYWCPICNGYVEAGGDSTCTCNDEDWDDYDEYEGRVARTEEVPNGQSV